MKKYIINNWQNVTIAIISVGWIVCTPSINQKGGVNNLIILLMPITILILAALFFLQSTFLTLLEKILSTVLFSIIGVVISLLIANFIFEIRHSNKTWFLWEFDEKVIYNATLILCVLSIFYLSNQLIQTIKRKFSS